jgi:hypothetical protein
VDVPDVSPGLFVRGDVMPGSVPIHRGKTFRNQTVAIDNGEFYDCTFDNCQLEFSGVGKRVIAGCHFSEDCRWIFKGAAADTLSFLSALYHHFGPHGRRIVEDTFNTIRAGQDNPPPTARSKTND